MTILKHSLVAVVAADMIDYQRWVATKSKDEYVRYTPIVNALQVSGKYDEIVITSNATTNANYYEIYKKLNGAYRLAKREHQGVF